jgi:hypothetical protein
MTSMPVRWPFRAGSFISWQICRLKAQGANLERLAPTRRRCWSPDGTFDTAEWGHRGRPFLGRLAVDVEWRRPFVSASRPDGNSSILDA